MGNLLKWLIFTVALGALPYLFSTGLTYLEKPGANPFQSSAEILFLALVASATALGELSGGSYRRRNGGRMVMKLSLGAGVLASSLLYGAYVHHDLHAPARDAGLDCSVVGHWASGEVPDDPLALGIVAKWGSACHDWAAAKTKFFQISVWIAGVVVVVGTAAVSVHQRPTGGGL